LLDQVYAPMLAQLDYRLPTARQWWYEPKLDGLFDLAAVTTPGHGTE
jgi:hypothetical protein